MTHYLIYEIVNLINGKNYIGAHQTTDKNDGYMGSGLAIKRALRKYGEDAFRKEIIFEASSKEEMFSKEKQLVKPGIGSYNLVSGGITGAPFGVARSEDVRAKISASKRGIKRGKYRPRTKPNKKETKYRKSRGVPRSLTTRLKISETKRAKRQTLENFND